MRYIELRKTMDMQIEAAERNRNNSEDPSLITPNGEGKDPDAGSDAGSDLAGEKKFKQIAVYEQDEDEGTDVDCELSKSQI